MTAEASNTKRQDAQLPQRKRTLVRRLLRYFALTLLVVVGLVMTLWLLRRQVLLPLLRPRLEAMLASALHARRVSIGDLDGDWIRAVEVHDLVVEGGVTALRSLRIESLSLQYDWLQLIGGDLSALSSVSVIASELQLDLTRSLTSESRPSGPVAKLDPEDLEPLFRMFPDGANVHVDRLRVIAPQGLREGAFDLDLGSGVAGRDLAVSFAGIRLAAHLDARIDARVQADDPGELLELFGVGGGVRHGTLQAVITAQLAPLAIAVDLDLAGLTFAGQKLDKSHIVAQLSAERLAIGVATLELPGIFADLHDVVLQSPFASTAPSLHSLAGRIELRIDDLTPYVRLLPEQVVGLLPVRARIAAAFADGQLNLESSEVQARGAHLALAAGSLAFADSDWRAARGSLRYELTLAGLETDLPALGRTELTGRVHGTVTGSGADPHLVADLELGSCRCEHGSFADATGRVLADRAFVAVAGLHVSGLLLPALSADAASSLSIDASCRLRAGGLDPDTLTCELDANSLLATSLLAPSFAACGLPAPRGAARLQLLARHTARGIEIETLHATTAPESPVEIEVDGEGTLPVHWSATRALETLTTGTLTLRARVAGSPTASEDPPLAASATLRIDANTLLVRPFAVTSGAFSLHGELASASGVAALFDPGAKLSECELEAALELDNVELARLPAGWTGGTRLGGQVSGSARAKGLLRSLDFRALLVLADGEFASPDLPRLSAGRLRLEARSRKEPTNGIEVGLELSAALDAASGQVPKVALSAKLVCDDQGTSLEPTVLHLGTGEIALHLRSSLRWTDLFSGTVDRANTTLAGGMELRELALEGLPESLLGIAPQKGFVTGALEFDGDLGPRLGLLGVASAQLSLRDGEIKAGALPRIEKLAAQVTVEREVVTLRSLTGLLGAGKFSAHGTLRGNGVPLATAWEDSVVDLVFAGEDLLLYRGDGVKVRSSVHLTAAGTPRAVAIAGEVVLGRGSKYVRRISLIPDLNARGGATASTGLRLFELPRGIGDRVTFDVAIRTSAPFEVRTTVFDGEVDLATRLTGKGSFARLLGTLALRDGILRFPGANLRVTSGLLTFSRGDPLYPELLVRAEGKRMGIEIAMAITGRYDRPEVTFSSVPPLPPQDIVVLLTTGQLPSTLVERGPEGQARFVGGYLAKEVLESYFGSQSTERGENLFDRLTIETGREVSPNGTESVLVEFELTKNLAVQAERDAHEDYNMGLVLRFRFR